MKLENYHFLTEDDVRLIMTEPKFSDDFEPFLMAHFHKLPIEAQDHLRSGRMLNFMDDRYFSIREFLEMDSGYHQIYDWIDDPMISDLLFEWNQVAARFYSAEEYATKQDQWMDAIREFVDSSTKIVDGIQNGGSIFLILSSISLSTLSTSTESGVT